MIVADLHIHSRYSRATARSLDPERLWLAAQRKGVDLLGSGDFTHPAWLAELREKLVPTEDGALELRLDLAQALAGQTPASCRRPVRFLLSGEISCIYKRGGRTRKVHSLILMPDFAAVERLNARLGRLGNITSDGRPILGLDTRDLLALCLEVEPRVIFIPAHIWTPWFSLFGSNSGFDAIEECFGDLSGHIQALETGLSSDPPMNWRLKALDRFTLVSNSDAHSPGNLAREANLLECEPSYPALARALTDRQAGGFAGTLEFFPDEGKYHLDGHRKCGVRLTPAETRAAGGRCPVCGGPLTVGVLSRVEELADRPPGGAPPAPPPFESLVPLAEVLSEVMQRGPSTKGVKAALEELLERLGPALYILRQAPLQELGGAGGSLLAEALRRMRAGEVWVEGGFDGQFGVVRLFSPAERQEIKGQDAFWSLAPARRREASAGPAPPGGVKALPGAGGPLLTPLDPALEGLNPAQARAVEQRGAPLIVRAGPGTGKTRVLVQRAVRLVGEGLDPARILMVTFTRKAAAEMGERLAAISPAAGSVAVGTLHWLGREILSQALGAPPAVADEAARLALIAPLARELGVKPSELAQELTRCKQILAPPPESVARLAAYQGLLAGEGLLDLDDLVLQTVLRLHEDQGLARVWSARFDHILVDEYQDVNPVQVGLLRSLAGPGVGVTAIGDPDQAIYGFRGADRSLFRAFPVHFPGAVQMGLSDNYRSGPAILALAQALLAGDPDPARLALRPRLAGGPLPVLCEMANPEAEAEWVAAKVVGLLGGVDSRQVEQASAGPVSYGAGDMAVLYRLHAQAPTLKEALERAGVPVQVAAREPLAETDPLDFKAQRVSLLTMHAAKGLEFPVVFVTGLEEGLLPYQPPQRPLADLAEERRLLFVALTRARERLYLSRARARSLYGQTLRPALTPLMQGLDPSLLSREKAAAHRRRVRQLGLFAT